jgi:hypothetical protein
MKNREGHMKAKLYFWIVAFVAFCSPEPSAWKPLVDWGHWRLGQKADLNFLTGNKMTVTFGSGAPSFESTSRLEFEKKMQDARVFNKSYHEKNYIVLRYLSTSLNGETQTNQDIPAKGQIDMVKFYNEHWEEFTDYCGAKPAQDPTTWITIRPDGTFPFYRYAPYGQKPDEGFETWGCPNNPHYVRMMEGRIRAQAETGIDGSYVDWTQIAGGTCYCPFCQQAFIRFLNRFLPPQVAEQKYGTADYDHVTLPVKRGDLFWMEWVIFRCQSVAEFHKRLRTVAQQINPAFMISGNVFGGFGYGPIAYDAAGNMEMLGVVDDFIYSEIQEFLDSAPRRNDQGTKISNSPALKFLSAASHGKPVIVYATEITPPVFPDPSEKCLNAMAQINIAEAVANHCIFREKRLTPPGAAAFYQFLASNEKSLVGARLYGNIAIMASLNQYFADELSFAFSTSRVLADRGVQHVLIVKDDILSGAIHNYDLIVLPYLPLLSIQEQELLIDYVKNGGTLLLLGSCGVKNEYNAKNPDVPLTALFGGKSYPASKRADAFGKGRAVFIPMEIPAGRFLIPMKAKGEFTTFGPTMADVFADIPEAYTRNNMNPGLRAVLQTAADDIVHCMESRYSHLAQTVPYVEMTTMLNQQEKQLLVHLVNYNVTVDGTITPAAGVELNIILPAGTTAKALRYSGSLSQMEPVDYTTQDLNGRQAVQFKVNSVEVYGLAVVDLQ